MALIDSLKRFFGRLIPLLPSGLLPEFYVRRRLLREISDLVNRQAEKQASALDRQAEAQASAMESSRREYGSALQAVNAGVEEIRTMLGGLRESASLQQAEARESINRADGEALRRSNLLAGFDIRIESLSGEIALLRQSLGRTVAEALSSANSGKESGAGDIVKKLDELSREIVTLRCFFVMKEIDAGIIHSIVRPPELRPDVVADLYTNFSINYAPVPRIRQWFAAVVEAISAHCHKSLSHAERVELLRGNVARTQATPVEMNSLCAWLNVQAANHVYCAEPEELLPLFQRWADDFPAKKNWTPDQKRTWLRYVCLLLEAGDTDKAKFLLRRIDDSWGKRDMHRLLPVAYFADQCGITDSKMRRSAMVWEAYLRQEKTFADEVRGKRVAVVGNGPQELGKGRGGKIDSYDVVIRMNRAVTSPGMAKDYGRKTTLIGGHINVHPDPAELDAGVTAFFHRSPIHRMDIQPAELAAMEAFLISGKSVFFYDQAAGRCVRDAMESMPPNDSRYKFIDPSTGFYLAVMARAFNPSFTWDDLYGFSAKEDGFEAEYENHAGLEDNLEYRHYDGWKRDTNRFNWNHIGREGLLLRRLFGVNDKAN